MSLKLFVDMLSPPCRTVYLFAKKNNIPVSFQMISVMKGDQHKEEFVTVNPLRKVPALTDGDFSMGESIPMMEYMAAKFSTADNWFPKDVQRRARVNEFLSWHHTSIRTSIAAVFWIKVMAAQVFKLPVPEAKLSKAVEDLNSSLDMIEKVFIKDAAFIGGDQISVADLVAIECILQPVIAGEKVFESRPKLSAWRERVEQAVGKQLYDEAHQALHEAKEKLKTLDTSKMEAFRQRALQFIS